MRDFRNIADEIMKDVHVTASLKAKTAEACRKRTQIPFTKYMAVAACLVLIFSVVRLSNLFMNNNPPITDNGNDAGISILSASPDSRMESSFPRTFDPLEKARKTYGSSLLVPGYIPEGFTMAQIESIGENLESGVLIHYVSDTGRFDVGQQKTEKPHEPAGSDIIDINGTNGFIISTDIDGQENPNTELYWYVNGVQYRVAGTIKSQEAINIAISMK